MILSSSRYRYPGLGTFLSKTKKKQPFQFYIPKQDPLINCFSDGSLFEKRFKYIRCVVLIFLFFFFLQCIAGSLNSLTSSVTELPNLPGVRRDVSLINPKLYKQFKASQSSLDEDLGSSSLIEEQGSLFSTFDDVSQLSKSLTAFPRDGSAYNDVTGRYSLYSQKKDRIAKKLPLPYSSTNSLPSFVTNTAHTAHFLAFFDEAASDVTEERSRKVEIKVYLEDNSLEIIEPRVENSGTVQGKFLKRHQVFKPVGRISADTPKELYTIRDFYAGAQVNIYNRIYTVVDCDHSTRSYLESLGLSFGPTLPFPKTLYDPKQRSSMSRPATRAVTRSKRAGFFDYDRKVLRFFGIWDSRSMLFGDVIRVKVHYTLADDTIDIVAIPDRNSGRDPNNTLLKKSIVMKRTNPYEASMNSGRRSNPGSRSSSPERTERASSPDNNRGTARPYHWKDLCIGEVVSVAALNVLLIDADEFTRDFYASHNMALAPPITIPEPNYAKLSESFSAPDDETSSRSLLPTAPVKDGLKAQLFQGLVLRYRAKIHTPKVRNPP
jgi:hypothetical protein